MNIEKKLTSKEQDELASKDKFSDSWFMFHSNWVPKYVESLNHIKRYYRAEHYGRDRVVFEIDGEGMLVLQVLDKDGVVKHAIW